MSDFIKNEEMIKSLTKEELFEMWEKISLENSKLKSDNIALKDRFDSEVKERDKYQRLYYSSTSRK